MYTAARITAWFGVGFGRRRVGDVVGSRSTRIAVVGRRAGALLIQAREIAIPLVGRAPSMFGGIGASGQRIVWCARDRWDAVRLVWNEARMAAEYGELNETLGDELNALAGDLVGEGIGVRLRAQVPANRPAFQRWYADPEIARLLRHDQEPLNSVQSRGYFDTIIMPLSVKGHCFAIHETDGDTVIGMSALTEVMPGPGTALFRIVIGEKDLWGRGYGTEATRLVAREAFERLGLREIKLEVFRHNPRALAAYDRVGFEIIGEHVEWVPRQGLKLEVIEMRLRRDEFWRREAERSSSVAVGTGGETFGHGADERHDS